MYRTYSRPVAESPRWIARAFPRAALSPVLLVLLVLAGNGPRRSLLDTGPSSVALAGWGLVAFVLVAILCGRALRRNTLRPLAVVAVPLGTALATHARIVW